MGIKSIVYGLGKDNAADFLTDVVLDGLAGAGLASLLAARDFRGGIATFFIGAVFVLIEVGCPLAGLVPEGCLGCFGFLGSLFSCGARLLMRPPAHSGQRLVALYDAPGGAF